MRRWAVGTFAAAWFGVTAAGCSNAARQPQDAAGESVTADSAAAASAPSAAPAPLPPVALPPVGALAESVQRQLRDAYATLAATLTNPTATPLDRARHYGSLGHLLLAATYFDDAVLCYRHAERLDPAEVRWAYYRAHAHVKAGDRTSAAAAFEHVTGQRPDYLPAVIWLADMYLDTGRADRAQATYARALALRPDAAVAVFGAGRAALARGAHEEAIAHLEAALRLDPQATAVRYPLAMAYRAVGNRDRATALLRERGSRPPALDDPWLVEGEVTLDSAVSHEGLGMQALRNQDWRGAVDAFRRALDLSPADPSLRYWLATALLVSGDTGTAEREFRTVVRMQPSFARAHFSLGVIHERRRQLAEARRAFAAAVAHAPNLPEAHLRLADTERALGNQAAAVPQYEAAVALDPGLADAWIGGAQTLIALGRRDAARDWLQRARRVHPDRQELAALAGAERPR